MPVSNGNLPQCLSLTQKPVVAVMRDSLQILPPDDFPFFRKVVNEPDIVNIWLGPTRAGTKRECFFLCLANLNELLIRRNGEIASSQLGTHPVLRTNRESFHPAATGEIRSAGHLTSAGCFDNEADAGNRPLCADTLGRKTITKAREENQ